MSIEKLVGQDLEFKEAVGLIEDAIENRRWIWVGDEREEYIINLQKIQTIRVGRNEIEIVLTNERIVLSFNDGVLKYISRVRDQ